MGVFERVRRYLLRDTYEAMDAVCEERDRLQIALYDLCVGGEFAAWIHGEEGEAPEMPLAAAKEYDEACRLLPPPLTEEQKASIFAVMEELIGENDG